MTRSEPATELGIPPQPTTFLSKRVVDVLSLLWSALFLAALALQVLLSELLDL